MEWERGTVDTCYSTFAGLSGRRDSSELGATSLDPGIALLLLDESYKIVLHISIEAYMHQPWAWWFKSSSLAESSWLISTISLRIFQGCCWFSAHCRGCLPRNHYFGAVQRASSLPRTLCRKGIYSTQSKTYECGPASHVPEMPYRDV